MRLSAYETYCLYLAIKSHFTTQSYDYHKYQGKIKVSKESFDIRKDRFLFQKLSRKYSNDKMNDFLISNCIKGKKWVGEFLDDDAEDIYRQYVKRRQSFTYVFANEIQKLFDSVSSPEKIFISSTNQSYYPPVIESYLSNCIGEDTLCVINNFFNFVPKLDRDLGKDDILWKSIRIITIKLLPFIEYDKLSFKNIVKGAINK